MTPHEQLVEAMAIGVRKQQFARIRRHAVFDETLPRLITKLQMPAPRWRSCGKRSRS